MTDHGRLRKLRAVFSPHPAPTPAEPEHLDQDVTEILERHAPPPATEVLTDALAALDITAIPEAAADGEGVVLRLSEGDARELANYLSGPLMEPAPGELALRASVRFHSTGTDEHPAPPVSDS